MTCNIYQGPDDSWMLVRDLGGGLVAPGIQMGQLSKEQAVSQAQRWGYKTIITWDKTVLDVIRKGGVNMSPGGIPLRKP